MKDFKTGRRKEKVERERESIWTQRTWKWHHRKEGKCRMEKWKGKTLRINTSLPEEERKTRWYTEELTQLLKLQASFSLQLWVSLSGTWHCPSKYLIPTSVACAKNFRCPSDHRVLGTSWNLNLKRPGWRKAEDSTWGWNWFPLLVVSPPG